MVDAVVIAAASIEAPVLLVHGDQDTTAPIEESQRMAERLAELPRLCGCILSCKPSADGHALRQEEDLPFPSASIPLSHAGATNPATALVNGNHLDLDRSSGEPGWKISLTPASWPEYRPGSESTDDEGARPIDRVATKLSWNAGRAPKRRRLGAVLAGAALCVALGRGAARASSFVCDTLGAAVPFDVVATKSLVTTPEAPFDGGETTISSVGAVCAGQATLQEVQVASQGEDSPPADLVATASRDLALKLLRGLNYIDFVEGDVVTGGGSVKLPTDPDDAPEILGVIDTSGHHPALARCQAAMSDAALASQAFAARPPLHSLGDVVVPRDQTLMIDATGDPIPVVEFRSLRLEGAPTYQPAFLHSGGTLDIATDPTAQHVILNVRKSFRMGADGSIQIGGSPFGTPVVVNVTGPGPQVVVGPQAGVRGVNLNILAPERSIAVRAGSDDNASSVSRVWGRNAKMQGLFQFFDELGCP